MPLINAMTIYNEPDRMNSPVQHALAMLYRDHESVLQAAARKGEAAPEG